MADGLLDWLEHESRLGMPDSTITVPDAWFGARLLTFNDADSTGRLFKPGE
jgi:hypothetical protein